LESLWIPAGIALGVLVFFVFVRVLYPGLARSGLLHAEILRLTPRFRPDHPERTIWLQADYVFQVRGTTFSGSCVLPLSYFLARRAGVNFIYANQDAGMPILVESGERFIGAETIEHFLLGRRDRIYVRYRTRDPSQNRPEVDQHAVLRSLERFGPAGG
ncbi:MAG: hypothetical protein KDK34_21370, partial [Leptospiraceae bacterium]|nr:hypothetical protein [Leptospiraceae bacterium]